MTIIELRKANEARGWLELPETCPARFVASICEKRALALQTAAPIYQPVLRAAPAVKKSLEQIFFEMTGREPRRAPFFRIPAKRETLEEQLARQSRAIQEESIALRFGTGFMSADEKHFWERQFAARTGQEIKVSF
jgi:hypothetical protein